MSPLQIKQCTEDDYSSIFGLLKQLWPHRKLRNETLQKVYNNALKSENQKLIAGLIDNKIIGFCSLTIKNNLWQAGNLGHIDELIVDNNLRGQGIGKKLIDEIVRIAKENKCIRIELDSALHREEAHLFYESIGFEKRAYLFSKEI